MKNKEHKMSRKQKIILNCSILGLVVAAIVVGYACLINFYLIDFENMAYIEFSYLYNDGSRETTVRVDKVYSDSDYPSDFRIPNKLLGYRVTEVGDSAFSSLDRLTNVTFPDSIVSIGEKAFYNCNNLKSFNVPSNLVYIGTDAFTGTSYLNNKTDGEVLIGHILYEYKGEFKPDTAIIQDYNSAAYLNKEYTNYISLNDYVSIGSGAFRNKQNLVYAEWPSRFSLVPDKLYNNCQNLTKVVLNEGITSIGVSVFDGCTSLNSVSWPSTLTKISEYAFKGASIDGVLSLPNSLTSIKEGAFQNCNDVDSVIIPSGIDYISDYLFDGCSSLHEITFSGEDNTHGNIYYLGTSSFAKTAIETFKIPFGVISIKESTFKDCASLKTVYLYDNTTTTKADNVNNPNGGAQGIKTISKDAFANDVMLTSLIIIDKDGNNISNVDEITFPGSTLTSIGEPTGESNIMANTGIKVLNVPSSINWIPSTFAKNCTSLTDINFLASINNISRIGLGAFDGCTSLVNVTLPSSITTLDAEAFANCTNLVHLNLASTQIKTLSAQVISNDTSLTTFVIPDSVKSIKSLAFENCTSLEYVIIPKSVTNCDEDAFHGCHVKTDADPRETFRIYLAEGVNINKYRDNWNSGFKYYIYSELEPTTSGDFWHYNSSSEPEVWPAI